MREAFVEINGVPTKVSTWGRWIEESNTDDPKDIVIFIPGNPGINGFYNKFAETIHKNTGHTVWCVGHAGHNLPQRQVIPMPKLEQHKALYGLKGQVEHKIAFLDKYVPKDAKVYLIGHSIGTYIILELLQSVSIKNTIKEVYFLFPTIENMAVTPNGKFLCNFVKPILWLILFLAFIFHMLPNIIQNFLVCIYMTIERVCDKEIQCENIKHLIKPSVLEKVFFLAFEEMDLVKERNNASLRENIDKIKFYYGDADGWTPLSYCENLKKDFPKVDCEIVGINHSFVLSQSITVGNTVSEWIKKK